jgi:hypothetical protein
MALLAKKNRWCHGIAGADEKDLEGFLNDENNLDVRAGDLSANNGK